MGPIQPSRVHVVVPCYEEGSRLDKDVFVGFIAKHPDVLFTFVNDGSRDNTLAVLQSIKEKCPDRVHVLDLVTNVGKAEAVRRGLTDEFGARAEYFGYWDADLATPLESIPDLAGVLDRHAGIDIVLGARVLLLGRKISRKTARHYAGRVFATGASTVLGIPIYDSQCGAKVIRRNDITNALFESSFNSRWIFDVEIIARYLQRGGTVEGLYEAPLLQWTDIGDSKVKPVDFFRAFGELAELYNRYSIGQPGRRVLSVLTNAFSRYLGVGMIGTAVHYIVLMGLVEFLSMRPDRAALVGAASGAMVNYYLNYHLTFASKARHHRTLPKFLAVALLSMAISGLGVRVAMRAGVHYLIAQAVCTVAILAIGFALNRKWTFRA